MTQGYGPGDGQQPQWGHGDQNSQQPQWGEGNQHSQDTPGSQWGQGDQQAQQPQWGQQPSPAQPPAQPQSYPAQPSPAQPQWNQVPAQATASQASPQPVPSAPNGYPGAATSPYPGATRHAGSSNAGLSNAGGSSTLVKIAQAMLILMIAVIAVRVIREVISFITSFIAGAAFSGGSFDSGMAVTGGGVVLNLLFLGLNGLVSIALLAVAIYVAVKASGRGRTGAIIVAATLLVAVVLYWILYGIYYAAAANVTDYSTIGIVSIIYVIAEVIRSLIVFAALIVGTLMARRWVKQNA